MNMEYEKMDTSFALEFGEVQRVGGMQPEGVVEIAENGEHDVTAYEKANVNVPIPDGYIQPSGTLEITENGEHDVTEYSGVSVDVPIPETPTGTLEITENGKYDVTPYAEIDVMVPDGGASEEDVQRMIQEAIDAIPTAEGVSF